MDATTMPTDPVSLDDYRVELDYYSGPLELLLYLVKRHEIDLHDIPIAELTDQYLEHLEQIKRIDIDLAGDFLVMAATLLEIKSRMIAPPVESDDEEADAAEDATDGLEGLDPRLELVQQLLAYKRYKDAALELDDRRHDWERRWAHTPTKLPKEARDSDCSDNVDDPDEDFDTSAEAEVLELDLEDVNINDLTDAFARIMASVGQGPARHEVVYDDTPIELHAEDIVDRLQRDGAMSLQQLFVGRTTRTQLIGLFLATLELVKLKRIRVVQDRVAGEIQLKLRADGDNELADEPAADWRDPETGEMQYDWPSEEAKQRAERRAKRKLENFKKRRAGEAVEDEDEDDIIDFGDETVAGEHGDDTDDDGTA